MYDKLYFDSKLAESIHFCFDTISDEIITC